MHAQKFIFYLSFLSTSFLFPSLSFGCIVLENTHFKNDWMDTGEGCTTKQMYLVPLNYILKTDSSGKFYVLDILL